MLRISLYAVCLTFSVPCVAADVYGTLQEPPKVTWRTKNPTETEFCATLALANRTRQAPTIAKRSEEIVIVVHDWDSPVPGSKVQGIVTIKNDGLVEFRGPKDFLTSLIEPCTKL